MTNMRYRRFGRTELKMPVLTCGGMRYQHSWRDVSEREIPRENQDNVRATILHALELGINHIETARGYGTSERQLGFVLPELPRHELIVQTKVGPSPSAEEFTQNFETSLSRLRLDYVDLLALHGINNREKLGWSLKKGGCLEAALKLKERGLVRHVGFSTHATKEVIRECLLSDGFEYMNVHYYFVNPINLEVVRLAQQKDMGVFIISPTENGGRLYAAPERLRELCSPLTPIQFNDLFCLSHPEIHTLSIGAARPSDLDEHVAALAHYDGLRDALGPIEARVRAAMEAELGAEWCKGFWEGVPEFTELPGEINVREILRLYSFARGLGLVEWGKSRYNMLGRNDDWVAGNPASAFDESALRRALAKSPFPERVIESLRDAHRLLADEPVKRLSQR